MQWVVHRYTDDDRPDAQYNDGNTIAEKGHTCQRKEPAEYQ